MAFPGQSGSWWRRRKDDEAAAGNERIIPRGWDHEHCRLCWATLSAYEGDEHEGYTDESDWLCTCCFDRFIASGLGQRMG